MKLEIREDSKNYACVVVKLPIKQKVEGLDKLCKVTVFGSDVLTKKDADENQLYLFFPAECRISEEYLKVNNEFRDTTKNIDQTQKGYFEDTGRVKSIKFKGIISTGYITPVSTLALVLEEGLFPDFKEGDEFTDINGINICKKYKIVHQHSTTSKESRFNKKLKRFDKLVPNQFRFHTDTSQLAKNLHVFQPEDIILISDKWHGTSAIFSNVLINKELTWIEKIAKFFGIDIVDKIYDNLYASRSVIKNQYINKDATAGYYNEDIWGVVNKELQGKIEQGVTLYGEIVGYAQSGKALQKDYDYGCSNGLMVTEVIATKSGEEHKTKIIDAAHKFVVYRITYTKPDGNTIEYSWNQIKDYCRKYQLETVKELYFGNIEQVYPNLRIENSELWQENILITLQKEYLEQDCKYCTNKVPAEGICVRIDGKDTYSTFKLKSKRFLEKESKQLDEEAKTGEVNIEDDTL